MPSQTTLPRMDPTAAGLLATELMAEHGLLQRGWSFAFNRRKRSLGLCVYTDKRIELSLFFVIKNDEPAVRDTVLHEIAHALAGHKAGHGPVWAELCRRLGATPSRICATAVMPRGVFEARCHSCSQVHHRYRRPKRNCTYYCQGCGPQLGKLRFIRTPAQAAANSAI